VKMEVFLFPAVLSVRAAVKVFQCVKIVLECWCLVSTFVEEKGLANLVQSSLAGREKQ
jgi:hypothetical protein